MHFFVVWCYQRLHTFFLSSKRAGDLVFAKKYAIKNLSFSISSGESIAIVGNNGAGKSTIIKLLMRFYNVTQDEILLNGESIYSYDLKEYFSFFAPAFQDYMIYSLTIYENLLFDNNKDDKLISEFIKQIGLDKKLSTLPQGLETPYTNKFYDNGVEFSIGEEQRLIVGRALAKKSTFKSKGILVLDEPTASLDPLSEYAIYEIVYNLQKNCTTFFVSHRLNTTKLCDKILVMDNGSLVEMGNHHFLMNQNSLYFSMYNMQKEYYMEKNDEP